jgi:hypothetical protein
VADGKIVILPSPPVGDDATRGADCRTGPAMVPGKRALGSVLRQRRKSDMYMFPNIRCGLRRYADAGHPFGLAFRGLTFNQIGIDVLVDRQIATRFVARGRVGLSSICRLRASSSASVI